MKTKENSRIGKAGKLPLIIIYTAPKKTGYRITEHAMLADTEQSMLCYATTKAPTTHGV
jgi:hypothetical protein